MSFTMFLQLFANVAFTVGLFVIFARLRRPAKDDPRLSKGLQLLSSKIAVLEDLSDRTETQVQQMLLLLDQKSKELQSKIALAEQQVLAVRQSMNQSLEVAQIFQDKIPHTEIIERQNSVKYIRAARLAHAGVSVADIAREVDLPLGEIEFIAKVNQDSLSFREEELPAWARDPNSLDQNNIDHLSLAASVTPIVNEQMPIPTGVSAAPAGVSPGKENYAVETYGASHDRQLLNADQEGLVQRLSKLQFEMKNLDLELAHRSSRNVMPDMSQAFEAPRLDSSSLEKLGEEFRRAVEEAERAAAESTPLTLQSAPVAPQNLPSPSAKAPTASTAPIASTESGSTLQREVSIPELEAARAAAAALRSKDAAPVSVQTLQGPQTVTKSVRRVEFPRI
jgi:hypothetical protein